MSPGLRPRADTAVHAHEPAPVAVLGAGSWGTALAIHLARQRHEVRLWGHRPVHVAALAQARCNQRYLPQATFPANLQPVVALKEAVAGDAAVLIAVPCRALHETLQALLSVSPQVKQLALACKGLEPESLRLPHELAADVLGQGRPVALISGPTFAAELAAGLPAATTVAATGLRSADDWARLIHSDRLRAYTTTDVVGVALGGALKNVIAIAAGVADGLGFGANSRAALITRGLAEMRRLGQALGGRQETFMGLAGMGDLVLTCTDDQSRNRRFGLALGRGRTVTSALAEIGQVVEGMRTVTPVRALAQQHGVRMPITEQVYQLVHGKRTAQEAVARLMGGQHRHEAGEVSPAD